VPLYYYVDGLGSIVAVTNAARAVAASYVYESFGATTMQTQIVVSPFGFTGREFSNGDGNAPGPGLYYYRARYYDPSAGRFISEDLINFTAEINFYAYVSNSPINQTDPSGLFPPIRVTLPGKVARLVQSSITFLVRDLHETRRAGHHRFPGELNSPMRHCTISCELALRWPIQIVRASGVVNELQGLILDVRNIRSRISGESPEAAQVVDLVNNERGFACAERVRSFRLYSCEECCGNKACSGGTL